VWVEEMACGGGGERTSGLQMTGATDTGLEGPMGCEDGAGLVGC